MLLGKLKSLVGSEQYKKLGHSEERDQGEKNQNREREDQSNFSPHSCHCYPGCQKNSGF